MIVLLSIVVFMTVMLIPVYLKALKSARLHSTDFLSGTINNGVLHFERSINSAISLNTQMQSTAFSEVKRLDDASFSPENLVKLIQVQQLFSVITRNIDPGHVFYMLFNNNRKVITASESSTNTIYMDNSVFFSTYMVYEALKENVLSLLARLDSSGIGFIPSTSIRINFSAAEDYLTLIVRIPGSSVTICVLYKTSELLSLLGMNILPDAAYLSLKRDNGSEIVSTKAVPRNRDRYTEISFEIPTIHGVLTVGVPESFYIEQVRETKKLVDRYLWGAIVLGLVLAVMFAVYSYLPIYRLVRLNELNTSTVSDTNDFEYLRNVSEQFASTNHRLQSALDSMHKAIAESTLTNILFTSGDSNSTNTGVLQEFQTLCRVCLIDVGADKSENVADEISVLVYRALSGEGFYTVHATRTQLVTLLKESQLEKFKSSEADIASLVMHEYASQFTAVLSAAFSGAEAAREAYLRTQLVSIFSSSRFTVVPVPGGKPRAIREYADLQQLTAAMRAGEEDKIHYFFRTALASLIEDGGSMTEVKRLYGMLSAAPTIILSEQNHAIGPCIVPLLDPGHQVADQFDSLRDLCIEIMQKISKSTSRSGSYKERVIEFINSNFQNPDMYAGMIAEKFSVSTKQVYRILREQTGSGFSEYLDTLRMRLATRLLTQSRRLVKDVARCCGYSSVNTFDKAFKKSNGCSPSKYRRKQ